MPGMARILITTTEGTKLVELFARKPSIFLVASTGIVPFIWELVLARSSSKVARTLAAFIRWFANG